MPAHIERFSTAEAGGRLWSCVWTRPRHEKSVASACASDGVEYYLPLRTVTRRYRSGRKVRTLPLFPGYLFACVDPEQRGRLQQTRNLLGLLDVADQEGLVQSLNQIDNLLAVSPDIESLPHLVKGRAVEVCRGPFRGTRGVLVEVRRNYRVALNVDFIGRSLLLEVDADDVEPL